MPYVAPERLEEALDHLAEGGWHVLAGGTDIFPAHVDRAPPRRLLDITRIGTLSGISLRADGSLRIGAATRWSRIAAAPLPPAFDALRQAAREIGGRQIQNAGTIGGNLCNASPAADGVPPLLVLDAEVELAGVDGPRHLSLADFISGPRQTALRPGEMLVAIRVPPPAEGARSAFLKLGARRHLVISIAMVAALVSPRPDGRIGCGRVAVGAASPVARRLPALEADLPGSLPRELAPSAAHLAPLDPIDDVRADAAYRRAAVATLIPRAVALAMTSATPPADPLRRAGHG